MTTTFSWNTGTGGIWTNSADWSPNGVPSGTDVAVFISHAGVGYGVTIAAGDTEIVNQFTIGNTLVGGGSQSTPTLEVGGTLQLAGTSATSAFLQGALLVDSSGVIDGAGHLGGSFIPGIPFNFTNNGTVIADAGSGTSLYIQSAFTNNGTVLADDGSLYIEGTSFANFAGTTLTGGNYVVQGPAFGTFNQIGFALAGQVTDIAVDAANIVLDGGATDILGFNGGFQKLELQLQTVASTGSLQLLSDRGYRTSLALTDNGLLNLQGGSLATGGLTIGGTGLFEGFGVVSGSVSDGGGIIANGGALYIPGTVAGGGALAIDAGSSLILAGATPASVNNQGIVYDTSGLLNISALSGSGTLVVQSGGTLAVPATAETIVFSGTNAAVTLQTPSLYSGTLAGFGLTDSLVLDGVSANTAHIVNGNTLAVISGGTTLDTVTLAGNYSGATFLATTDGTNTTITNTSGAPARDDMAFSIAVSNSTTLTAGDQTAIVNDLSAAALDWAQYVTGHAPLRIQLNITSGASGSELANGGFTSYVTTNQVTNGETIVIPSSIYALTTGNYVAGTTADIVVNLPLNVSDLDHSGGLYANPSPFSGSGSIPSDEYDLVTVFRHELAHGLGFGGFTDQNGNLGSVATLFDSYTSDTLVNGSTITAANFVGPDAEAAYGAFLGTNTATQIPLTLLNNGENFAHVANSSSDPLGQDLMSGVGLLAGQSRDISTVDLAMLQDVGLPVTAEPICFLRGTYITTPSGEVPVEQLQVGHQVLTHSGAARPIVWIGEGKVLATRGRRTAATPVIVRKGALADNVPHHDLRVTKAHALYFNGALVPVEFLVNHRSILWDDRAQEVEIFHIELESHDVLLANGTPAESYRDDGNRWLFRNANTGWHLPPKPPCAPVLTGGDFVDALWQRLLDRAGPRPGLVLTDDPDLHILADDMRVDAVRWPGAARIFTLSHRPQTLRIVSRAAVPAELGVARDPRCLGVAVQRIALRQGTRFHVIEAADPSLIEGFHPFEPATRLRWTNGDAALPAGLLDGFDGPLELVLHLGSATRYAVTGAATPDASERRAA